MRLAWFSPMPPSRSGIAAYSNELLPLLADTARIDVYVEDPGRVASPPWEHVRVRPAHDFVWRRLRDPYDLVVYQLGNAACHDYMWPYLTRHPGLTVLHDGHLHHGRAHRLVKHGRWQDYEAEFVFDHPRSRPDVTGADFGFAGLAEPFYYFWPMVATVPRVSRLVAVHSPWLAADLRETCPQGRVITVPMGVADPLAVESSLTVEAVRAHHGIPGDALLFAAYGLLTPEKRLGPIFRAFSTVLSRRPDARLALVGAEVGHYDVRAEAAKAGVADRVIFCGYIPDDGLPAYLAAADVCLCLRWPSARETSASWLRCVAAGKPTVVTDLIHTVDTPTLDPRTWTVGHAPLVPDPSIDEAPIAVAIDILDEDHSLRIALQRLAVDGALRSRLGAAARDYWKRRHTLSHMAAAYRSAIEEASRVPDPDLSSLPAHLREDGTTHGRSLVAPFGVEWPLA